MKKLMLLTASLAVLGATAAMAADVGLPVKANALLGSPCTPTMCTGFYVGGGVGGNGSNADIIGNGLSNSVFAGGVIPQFDLGYQFSQNNWFFGGEADFAYQMASVSTVNGIGGNQNGFLFQQIVKVGGNLSGLLGTQDPITIPPKLANALISPYIFVGLAEHSLAGNAWASGVASGAGATFDVNQNWFIDLRYTNIQYGSTTSGPLTFNNQNIVSASFNYKFNSNK